MLGNLSGWHFVILLVIILLVFGAAKLPALAKSLGQSVRIFRGEMKTMRDEQAAERRPEVVGAPAETVVERTTTPVSNQASGAPTAVPADPTKP